MSTKQLPPLIDKFLNEVTRKHAPNAQIRFKSESWLMKAIAFVVKPFNPSFFNDYITTLGTTIWVPDNFFDTIDPVGALEVISHETQHIIDYKKYGSVLFVLLYGFPQILALLSVLALGGLVFHSAWWLLWLLTIGLAAPIPAYGRYRFELNGYRTAYVIGRFVRHFGGTDLAQLDDWVVQQLGGQWYYFTWPFTKMIRKDLQNNSFLLEPRYVELINWLKANGLAS